MVLSVVIVEEIRDVEASRCRALSAFGARYSNVK